jgi:tRNA(Arg) A34 adenosine deaminase TadA
MNNFLDVAIEQSELSIAKGGGPFGAVIIRNNEIIAVAHNTVTIDNDPTAHAEINAIRIACKKLGTFDLHDCEIYSSCEPCPMCLSAIYWARIPVVYFANTKTDAAEIGFSDNFIYEELNLPPEKRKLKMVKLNEPKALEVFQMWQKSPNQTKY